MHTAYTAKTEAAFDAAVKDSREGSCDPEHFHCCGIALSSLRLFKSLKEKRKRVGKSRKTKKTKGEVEGKQKDRMEKEGRKENHGATHSLLTTTHQGDRISNEGVQRDFGLQKLFFALNRTLSNTARQLTDFFF